MKKDVASPPFDLLRWFAWLSSLVIAAIAISNAWLITGFLNQQLYRREAETARDFIQNVLDVDGSAAYLGAPDDGELARRFASTMNHLTAMPDVLRANVFAGDGRVIWSSEAGLIGRQFSDNDELAEAKTGQLVVHGGLLGDRPVDKAEHHGLPLRARYFVETYIPLRGADGVVLGVVELYKVPRTLSAAIEAARRQVLVSAGASALLLYLTLFWLIRRADRTIRAQHERLLQSETLVAVGELASAMAHNIRNPLSSIRSAAELGLDRPAEPCPQQLADIVAEVERIGAAVNDLLHYSQSEALPAERVDLNELLAAAVREVEQRRSAGGITWLLETLPAPAPVLADRQMLLHVFVSLLTNALEAMTDGGHCQVRIAAQRRNFEVSIEDNGSGLSAEARTAAMRPFFTTKARGLGLGLPLAQRIVGRLGGSLRLQAAPGSGTQAIVVLPALQEKS